MTIKIMIIMKKALSIFIILIFNVLVMTSCFKKQDKVIITRDFQSEQWGRFDFLEADFEVLKAPMTSDVVMDIVVSDVYPNIYPYHEKDDTYFTIVLSVKAPDGSRRSKDYKFRLKDAGGNFKSEKIDGYYNFELPLINDMSFSEVGIYHFKIENKYPKDPLFGIKSLTVSCK